MSGIRTRITGFWLLESPNYKQWKEPRGPQSIWLSGLARSGEAVLTAAVTDDLDTCMTSNAVAVFLSLFPVSGPELLGGRFSVVPFPSPSTVTYCARSRRARPKAKNARMSEAQV